MKKQVKTITIQTTEQKLIAFIKDYIMQEIAYRYWDDEGEVSWGNSALEIIFGDKAGKCKELVDNVVNFDSEDNVLNGDDNKKRGKELNKLAKKIIKELNLL